MATPTNEALQGARTLLATARAVGDTRGGGAGIVHALESLEQGLSARVSDRAQGYSRQTGSLEAGMEWALAEVLDEQALRKLESLSGLGTIDDLLDRAASTGSVTPSAPQEAQEREPALWERIMGSVVNVAAVGIREIGGAYRSNQLMQAERARTRAEAEAIRAGLWPAGTSTAPGGAAPAGQQPYQAPPNNTALYVGGGLAVLTLGGILVYVLSKKK